MQKYQILSVIGEGAYGVVLKCRDAENDSYVAIKKFKETDDEQLTKKITIRQIKILKMLSHQNIVTMHEAFRKKGIVYLVFEYVENNLLEILEKHENGLPPHLIKKIIFQLLKGIAHLHSLGIVHRDIKPENLLISHKNELKICDFGFARQDKKEKNELQLTDYVATRWYRAPELLVGQVYAKQIDIWAVGCIMCQLIDGNPIFPGKNQLQQIYLIQKMFGPLPTQLHQRFIKNQRYLGVKFPQPLNTNSIEKRYFGKIESKGLSFVKYLLNLNPEKRPSALQALSHPYFENLKSKRYTHLSSEVPESLDRKQTYVSVGVNCKNEGDNSLQKMVKYGKIYNNNKRKTNYNIAIIYQTSNTNTKRRDKSPFDSVDKSRKKLMTECDNGTSSKKTKNFQIQRKVDSNLNYYHTKMDLSPLKKQKNGLFKKNEQFPLLIGKKSSLKKASSRKKIEVEKNKRNQTLSKLNK